MKESLTLFLLFFCGVFCDAGEKSKPDLGMWIWSQSAFDTAEARKRLLEFCADEGITRLDQHVSIQKNASGYSLKNAEALAKLILEAHKQGITMNALRGSGRMFFEGNHEKALQDLRGMIAFDKGLPSGVRLSGVKYDVEPYGTVEWKAGGEGRKKVMVDYLSFLTKAKALLRKEAPHLTLSVDVPFWWDKEEFSLVFRGNEKLFVEHVQDLADSITIMSYRPNAKGTLKCVEQELAYAEEIGKRICPAIETGELKGKESWLSFHEKSPAAFRQTVGELQESLSGNTAIGCIMIHHYGSLVPYLKRTAAKPVTDDGP